MPIRSEEALCVIPCKCYGFIYPYGRVLLKRERDNKGIIDQFFMIKLF